MARGPGVARGSCCSWHSVCAGVTRCSRGPSRARGSRCSLLDLPAELTDLADQLLQLRIAEFLFLFWSGQNKGGLAGSLLWRWQQQELLCWGRGRRRCLECRETSGALVTLPAQFLHDQLLHLDNLGPMPNGVKANVTNR